MLRWCSNFKLQLSSKQFNPSVYSSLFGGTRTWKNIRYLLAKVKAPATQHLRSTLLTSKRRPIRPALLAETFWVSDSNLLAETFWVLDLVLNPYAGTHLWCQSRREERATQRRYLPINVSRKGAKQSKQNRLREQPPTPNRLGSQSAAERALGERNP